MPSQFDASLLKSSAALHHGCCRKASSVATVCRIDAVWAPPVAMSAPTTVLGRGECSTCHTRSAALSWGAATSSTAVEAWRQGYHVGYRSWGVSLWTFAPYAPSENKSRGERTTDASTVRGTFRDKRTSPLARIGAVAYRGHHRAVCIANTNMTGPRSEKTRVAQTLRTLPERTRRTEGPEAIARSAAVTAHARLVHSTAPATRRSS
jgi:hypothetical protein